MKNQCNELSCFNPNCFEKTEAGGLFSFLVKLHTAFQSKHETRHVFYRMLAVCALLLLLQSYVITFLRHYR